MLGRIIVSKVETGIVEVWFLKLSRSTTSWSTQMKLWRLVSSLPPSTSKTASCPTRWDDPTAFLKSLLASCSRKSCNVITNYRVYLATFVASKHQWSSFARLKGHWRLGWDRCARALARIFHSSGGGQRGTAETEGGHGTEGPAVLGIATPWVKVIESSRYWKGKVVRFASVICR